MDLDPVREEFIADVGPFVAGMELAIEAARSFRDEVLQDVAALEALHGAMASGVFDVSGFERQAQAARDSRDAFQALGDATRESIDTDITATEVEKLLADATQARRDADLSASVAEDILAGSANRLTAATNAASGAAYHGYGAWSLLTREYTLWGGLLGDATMVGKIAGWHIALDGLMEATIALGEGLSALSVGLASMVPAGEDIYTHLQSVSDVSNALGVTIPPLTGKFQDLSQAMAPQTVEAYGGALRLLAGNGTVVAQVAHEVVTGLDDWIAKLDLFDQANGTSGKFLQDGVGFLHQFEEAVDNVGDALHNMMAADPGTAHFLMDFVVLGTDALRVISEIPAPVLEAALALHSFMLWGGLAATQVVKLVNPLRAVALGMGEVKDSEIALTAATAEQGGMTALKATIADIGTGFATWGRNIGTAVSDAEGLGKVGAGLGSAFSFVNPVAAGVTVLAAGIGYLTYEMLQSSQASKQFAASVDQAMTQDSTTQFLTQYPQLVKQGSAGLSAALSQQTNAWKSYNIATHNTVEDLKNADFPGLLENAGKAIGDFFTSSVKAQDATNAVGTYTGKLATLNSGEKALLLTMDGVVSQGYNVSQSLGLMDLAGVKAADGFGLAHQKVENLITGYENMSVAGPALANSVNAVTFASDQQDSKVQALTQAWTTFLSTVTGGESSFVSFAQQVQGTFGALSGGSQLNDTNGAISSTAKGLSDAASAAASTGVSMTGLSADSLQLRDSFTQSITSASGLYNSLETMASAAGLGKQGVTLLSQASKDMVAELAPLAKGSQAATAELYALAQQGGYKGADSLKALTQWAGNGKNAMTNLDGITTILTKDSANLAQDVENLANAIGQDLNQNMAQAILQASGGQKAFDQFATAVLNSKGNIDGLRTSGEALATSLIKVYGSTQTAHAEFDTLAEGLHLTKGQADTLWNSIEAGSAAAAVAVQQHASQIIGSLNTIPSTKSITFSFAETGVAGTNAYSAKAAAEGWKVPGYGGGDTVPAMLEPGEAVVPKHLVPGVAPYLAAHQVPGFAAGGKVGSWDMADVFTLWGKEMWANDLKGHRAGHPISQAAMEALLSSVTQPAKLSGIWDNPAWRDYAKDLKADIGGYGAKDLEYWKLMGELKPPTKAQAAEIAHYEHEMHLHEMEHESGWVNYYRKKLDALEAPRELVLASLATLKKEGFADGGLVRSYDSGGYLPVGLSMAYNGTGKPEQVGDGGVRSPQPLHVHVNLDGREMATALVPDLVGAVNDYGYLNSGRPTGKLIPGP